MGRSLRRLLLVALAALVMRACVAEPMRVTDDSMLPVAAAGDIILVSKIAYGLRVPGAGAVLWEWRAPRKGDLVVAVNAGDPPQSMLRRITFLAGETTSLATGKPVLLAPGEFFLEAEQKEGAIDSSKFGVVPRRAILGRAAYRLFGKSASATAATGLESTRILEPLR